MIPSIAKKGSVSFVFSRWLWKWWLMQIQSLPENERSNFPYSIIPALAQRFCLVAIGSYDSGDRNFGDQYGVISALCTVILNLTSSYFSYAWKIHIYSSTRVLVHCTVHGKKLSASVVIKLQRTSLLYVFVYWSCFHVCHSLSQTQFCIVILFAPSIIVSVCCSLSPVGSVGMWPKSSSPHKVRLTTYTNIVFVITVQVAECKGV